MIWTLSARVVATSLLLSLSGLLIAQPFAEPWRIIDPDRPTVYTSPGFIKDSRTIHVRFSETSDYTEPNSAVVCLDSDGNQVWSYAVPGSEPSGGTLTTTDNLIYTQFKDRLLVLTQDGTFVWQNTGNYGFVLQYPSMRIFGDRLLINGVENTGANTYRAVLVALNRFTGAQLYTKIFDDIPGSYGYPTAYPKLRSSLGFAYLLVGNAGGTHGALYKLDPATGTTVGSYNDPAYHLGSFAIDSAGIVYAGGSANGAPSFRKINASGTGSFPTLYDKPIGVEDPLLSAGYLYIRYPIVYQGEHGSTLISKVKVSDGTVLWSQIYVGDRYTGFGSLFADKYGRLYLQDGSYRGGDYSSRLLAIDPSTGQELGSHSLLSGLSFELTNSGDIVTDAAGEFFVVGNSGGEDGTAFRMVEPMELKNDTYAIAGGGIFTTAGNGLLANDRYVNAKLATIEITTPPSQGTLTLLDGGEFAYDSSGVGPSTQTFTYRVTRASYQSSATGTIVVKRGLTDFVLKKNQLAGQNATLGTVTVGMPGAATTVQISDDSSLVTTPSSVVIASGQTHASFGVQVTSVNSQINTTITASNGGFTRTAPLTLVPLVPSAMAFSPGSTVVGGTTVTCRLIVNGVAGPGGRTISIFDNNAYSAVPNQVVVPAGKTEVLFTITTTRPEVVQVSRITAAVSAGSVSANLRITP